MVAQGEFDTFLQVLESVGTTVPRALGTTSVGKGKSLERPLALGKVTN